MTAYEWLTVALAFASVLMAAELVRGELARRALTRTVRLLGERSVNAENKATASFAGATSAETRVNALAARVDALGRHLDELGRYPADIAPAAPMLPPPPAPDEGPESAPMPTYVGVGPTLPPRPPVAPIAAATHPQRIRAPWPTPPRL